MYAKLDDRFYSNPKARAVGLEGRALYIAGLCHCAAHLTDGFIRADMLPVIAAEAEVPPTVAELLVAHALWILADCGWDVHGYLEWNQSKSQVGAKREADRVRQARRRTGDAEAESQGESQASHAVSPRTRAGSPVQSSPVLCETTSSLSVLPVGTAPTLVDDVLDCIADRRTDRAVTAGTIKSSRKGYRDRTRANLADEIGPRVLEVIGIYDEPARRLAEIVEGALDGRNANRRQTVAVTA